MIKFDYIIRANGILLLSDLPPAFGYLCAAILPQIFSVQVFIASPTAAMQLCTGNLLTCPAINHFCIIKFFQTAVVFAFLLKKYRLTSLLVSASGYAECIVVSLAVLMRFVFVLSYH